MAKIMIAPSKYIQGNGELANIANYVSVLGKKSLCLISESGGIAAAHAIHNGFTVLPACHHMYHGEKVAFGTLAQLVLENAPMEEIEEVLGFCTIVGLPTTLKQLGINQIKPEEIMEVAKAATSKEDTTHNMPFEVTPEDVYAAILTANKLGEEYM